MPFGHALGLIAEGAERQRAEQDDADGKDRGGAVHDASGERAPRARLALPGARLGGPEDGPAEDGQHRGKQRQPGDEHDADGDGQRNAEVGVDSERRGQQREQRGDDGEPGERDRLADPRDGLDDGLPLVQAVAQVLSHSEDQEQAVVGAGADHQHLEHQLGEAGDLETVLGQLGDHRPGDRLNEERRDHRDERRQQRPEDQQQQSEDEYQRQRQDRAAVRAGLLRLVHADRDGAGEVRGDAGWQPRAADGGAQASDEVLSPCWPPGRRTAPRTARRCRWPTDRGP